jgi:hypothetical protein
MIASRYDLYFPMTGSKMWLEFGALNFRNPQNERFPLPVSFLPPDPASVSDPRDLDRPPPPRPQD